MMEFLMGALIIVGCFGLTFGGLMFFFGKM